MMTRLRSHNSWYCVFGMTLFVQAVCGLSSASAATDEETFAALDLNQDGVLSGLEVTIALPFDADKDGEVTKDEYLVGSLLERQRFLALDDGQLFKERDSNADDTLSGKEVLGFQQYDADNDGEVSRQEFDAGRATDRKQHAGPSPEEMARQAQEKFQQLDINQDGRLSGKELAGYETLDANGDRRVSEKEFLAGFVAEPTADPAGVPPPIVFLEMIRTADPTAFLKMSDPEFAQDIDAPVLTFVLKTLTKSLGEFDPSAQDAPKQEEQTVVKGQPPYTFYSGPLQFKTGVADGSLVVAQNRIMGFQIKSPVLNDLGDQLYQALMDDQAFGKSTAEFYTPRCEAFVRLVLKGGDEKAFATFHPDVQKQVGREPFQNVFVTFRTNCGSFKGFELESLRVESDANMKGENYQLTHFVRGSKENYMATTTFQFIGLKADFTGFAVRPATEEESNRPAVSNNVGGFTWVKVPATAEGVSFEMPGKPERAQDEKTKRVTYSFEPADQLSVWNVFIDTAEDNLEARAKELFDYMEEALVTNTEGELVDSDEFNAGKHPGRMHCVKVKTGVFVVERIVIVGSRAYHFQVTTSEQDKTKREAVVNRFFDSVQVLETDDDVPAAPTPPPSESPGSPKPPVPKPPVPKPPVP